VVALSGLGGIGKTALAIHVAHGLRQRFPDGQVYVNLRGAHPLPTPVAEVLAGWLHDLGLPESAVPVGPEQQAAAFRSAVDGRRMLFLLDDARDAAQIRQLIPGAEGCAVLVTSRSRMSGLDGAVHVDLPTLDTAEAWELFSAVAGRTSVEVAVPAAQEILASCAGLPLAIRIIGTRVSGRFLATIPLLAERLRQGTTRLGELRHHDRDISAVFDQAFAALRSDDSTDGSAAHRLLLLCARWTGPDLGPVEAARLGRLPVPQAERLVDHLIEANLVQMTGAGRFGFHDLVRAYAEERAATELGPGEGTAAVARLVRWYLHSADAAARVITPHRMPALAPEELLPPGEARLDFADYDHALAWLTAQRPNLVAAARAAMVHGDLRAAWQLPVALWDLFNLRGHWQEWTELNQLGVEAAQALGDASAEGRSWANLGTSLHRLGRLEEAVEAQRRAGTIHEATGYLRGAAAAVFNLGALYEDLGRYEEALGVSARALALYRAAGNRVGEGHATAMSGEVQLKVGAYARALEQLERAAAIYRETGDRRNEASTLTLIGSALRSLGRTEQAVEALTRAIVANVEVGHSYDEAVGRERLAEVWLDLGAPGRAEPQLRTAHRIYRHTSPADAARIAGVIEREGWTAPS
jgi:tetratricopeptide (TPR) repeat protein